MSVTPYPPPAAGLSATALSFINVPPAESVLSGALAFLHIHESGGNNRGEMVERMLRDVGAPPGAPWCAAYVRRAGHYALLDPVTGVSRWPLPDTPSCQALANFARARDILSTAPVRGDVFLLWIESLGGFHHTGFVWSVSDTPTGYICTTLEGNTDTGGSHNGDQIAVRTRTFPFGGTARFINWVRLTLTEAAA